MKLRTKDGKDAVISYGFHRYVIPEGGELGFPDEIAQELLKRHDRLEAVYSPIAPPKLTIEESPKIPKPLKPEEHICPQCGKRLKNSRGLKLHIRTMHGVGVLPKEEEQ